ncbi:MAG: hypothetical protein ACPG7U_04615 [Holosporaceae bacterium]
MKKITCLLLCVGLLSAADKAMGTSQTQDPTAQEGAQLVLPPAMVPLLSDQKPTLTLALPVTVLPAEKEPEEVEKDKQVSQREEKFKKQQEKRRQKAALLEAKRDSVFRTT